MSAPAAQLSIHAGKRFACIKISGRANFTMGVDFQTLLGELLDAGYCYFVMDLLECLLMDSTFLGVLTGFGLKLQQRNGETAPCAIELLNPHDRVAELLENLGVIQLFKVTHGKLSAPECLETRAHEAANPTREETTRACLEAHETLMIVNPENVA